MFLTDDVWLKFQKSINFHHFHTFSCRYEFIDFHEIYDDVKTIRQQRTEMISVKK